MADRNSMQYGSAGGRGNNGQGFTRYQIAGDPSPYYPVFAAGGGGFQATPPAYMMPNSGGPYRYGNIHVNGVINMISDGNVLRPIMTDNFDLNGFNVATLLGGSTSSITTGQPAHTRVIMLQNALNAVQAILNHNGEMVYQGTVPSPAQYGAVTEGFTGLSGTAGATNGGSVVTITGGPTFSSVVLSTTYAYTPDFNNPRIGDILEVIVGGNSEYYRISQLNLTTGTLTSINIYPTFAQLTGSGYTYKLWRTGYGSASNEIILYNNEDIYLYYAGNIIRDSLANAGTLQCIKVNASSPFTFHHFMAPAAGGIGGRPAAVDVIYFKGFLLYGAGNAIGWSIAEFPSDFTTGFGATDLPAESVNAFQTTGTFLYFARVGDQVWAFFTNTIFLVTTTGSVPEFDFIQMPTSVGATTIATADPQTAGHSYMYQRGIAQGESLACYRNPSGLQLMQSTTPKRITNPIEAAMVVDRGEVQYSDTLGFFMLGRPDATQAFAYFWETNEWALFNFQNVPSPMYGLSPNVQNGLSTGLPARRLGLAAWENSKIFLIESFNSEFETDCPGAAGTPGLNSITPWSWATPIISLGDIYEGFQLGSFRPLIRSAEGEIVTPGQGPTFQATLYGGYSPTQMSVIYGPLTIDYTLGVPQAVLMPNVNKSDVPYIGFVFSGQRWCELVGVALYPTSTTSRR